MSLGAVQRERLVSAIAFAAAAALFGAAAVWAAFLPPDRFWLRELIAAPALFAVPAAVVGGIAGPHLAQKEDGLAAAVLGIGVTIGIAFLLVGVGGAIVSGYDILQGTPPGTVLSQIGESAVVLGFATLVTALVASPFGALGAYVAWHRIRRDDELAEART